MIKIEFSKEEYRRLLELLTVSGFVLNAYSEDETDEDREEFNLIQKVLKHAKAAGCDDMVEPDESGKYLALSNRFDDSSTVPERIEQFEETVFWGQLMSQLSSRDMVNALGEEKLEKLSDEEQVETQQSYSSVYEEEFTNHGLSRLFIRE